MALLCICDYFHYAPAKLMWVTDENNRRIIGMLRRIIGEIFKNYRIRIIGKIKSIIIRLRPSPELDFFIIKFII